MDDLNMYGLVADAVNKTNFQNKSANQIFGEIYTRVRSEVFWKDTYPHNDKSSIFRLRLKKLSCQSEKVKALNDLIKKLYLEKLNNEPNTINMELGVVAMECCLSELKDINNQSEVVSATLNKLEQEYV